MAKIKNDLSRLAYHVGSDTLTVELKTRASITDDFEVVETIVYNINELPDTFVIGDKVISLKAYAVSTLFQQRTSDFPDTNDKKINQRIVYDNLKNGQWRAEREGGSRTGSSELLVCLALAELKKLPLNQIMASWKKLDKEQQKAIKARPEVQAKMAELAKVSDEDEVDLTI